VIVLMNMVTREELLNEAEYEDILDDVRDECSKSGTVRSLAIPRPSPESPSLDPPGVGKVRTALPLSHTHTHTSLTHKSHTLTLTHADLCRVRLCCGRSDSKLTSERPQVCKPRRGDVIH
jgi:hypothetical protein